MAVCLGRAFQRVLADYAALTVWQEKISHLKWCEVNCPSAETPDLQLDSHRENYEQICMPASAANPGQQEMEVCLAWAPLLGGIWAPETGGPGVGFGVPLTSRVALSKLLPLPGPQCPLPHAVGVKQPDEGELLELAAVQYCLERLSTGSEFLILLCCCL